MTEHPLARGNTPVEAAALPGDTSTPRLADLPLFHPADPSAPRDADGSGEHDRKTRFVAATPEPATGPASLPGLVSPEPSAVPSRITAAGRDRHALRSGGRTTLGATARGPASGLATYDARSVDWALVRAFRQRASQKLAEQLRARPGVDEEDRRELGRSIIRSLLEDHARAEALDGSRLMDLRDEQALAAAVFDSLFGLGRLQPLVDQPDVENIEITGHDKVLLLFADGRREVGPPVADSDEELVEFLAFLAAQRGGGERAFSSANPVLHLNLGGRARLAAIMEVS
jgi:pilus assembly protein CpaF